MRPSRIALLAVWILAAAAVLNACSDSTWSSPTDSGWFAAARGSKAGSGPTVTLADPAWGNQGQTGEQVRILGSGFEPGSEVVWQRNGEPHPDVHVTSVSFVSTSELIATIDIDADAELSFYDIAVTRPSDRKSGIGTEKFEVTLAFGIGSLAGGNTLARAVNENGEVAGYSQVTPDTHAFFWSPATGMVDLGVGSVWGLSEDGITASGQSGSQPAVWSRDGATWTRSILPTQEDRGSARRLASDPVTGAALYISGNEVVGTKKNEHRVPLLWKNVDGVWQRIPLAVPPGSQLPHVLDVNALGQAVGKDEGGALLWEDAATVVRLPGPAASARAIRSDGNMVVGYGDTALYWIRDASGAWAGPHVLPDCWWGMGVDDAGNILASACAGGTPALYAPPYDAPRYLGQLGLRNEAAGGEAMTRSGRLAVGSASGGPISVGVIWEIW